uniref:Uncharacterized protein n=1 Tax=Arundo donax TaxID=35708 RepID=A0A0A9HG67_ARUDO
MCTLASNNILLSI